MIQRAFILGNPTGYYVHDLLEHAPAEITVQVIDYPSLQSLLAIGRPEVCSAGDFDVNQIEPSDLILVRSMGQGALEPIVFRMDCLAALEQMGCTVLNPPKALEWAIDKYASLSKLVRAEMPILPTHVSQTAALARQGFSELGDSVVIKPIFGGEGRGLMKVSDPDHADRIFRSLETMGSVIYQQQFLPNARDIRVLIIGQQNWAVERVGSDWRRNTARGANPISISAEDRWLELAKMATNTLGLAMAGVDLLIDQDDQVFILEVNGVPGWRGIEAVYDVSIAEKIWKLAME